MILAILLFWVGLMLSAFFSGSETGLYRVSRTRLVLDGLSGSRAAKGLVWLLNHPSIFVATTLVGNNIANYVTSLALVLGIGFLFSDRPATELLGPILLTPVVFVFGELLPKYLFFHAPYRLLMATRPFLLAATVILSPVSLVLGLLGSILQRLTGQTPFQLRLTMARRELDQVLRAGHEAGILQSCQRELAGKLFEVGNQPAVLFGVPTDRLAVVQSPVDVAVARRAAQKINHPIILIAAGKQSRNDQKITGFVWYADLVSGDDSFEIQSVVRGRINESHLRILLRLYDQATDVAVLYDRRGEAKCVVTRRQLLKQLAK